MSILKGKSVGECLTLIIVDTLAMHSRLCERNLDPQVCSSECRNKVYNTQCKKNVSNEVTMCLMSQIWRKRDVNSLKVYTFLSTLYLIPSYSGGYAAPWEKKKLDPSPILSLLVYPDTPGKETEPRGSNKLKVITSLSTKEWFPFFKRSTPRANCLKKLVWLLKWCTVCV